MDDLTWLARQQGRGLADAADLIATIDAADEALLAAEAKRVELGKPSSRPAADALVATLLVRRALVEDKAPIAAALKRINSALKAGDAAGTPSLGKWTSPGGLLEARAMALVADVEEPRTSLSAATEVAPATIPLTILFYEGPIGRAYLSTLAADGIRPERIIELVATTNLATSRPVGTWLPRAARLPYCAWHQRQQIHHWPRLIGARHSELRDQIQAGVRKLGFSSETLEDAGKLLPLKAYSDQVVRIGVKDLSDIALYDHLRTSTPCALLYTGGGIVPRHLLSLAGIDIFHVHPGHLPTLRGADCALWSLLTSHRFSASFFKMTSKIDEGPLYQRAWLPSLNLGPIKEDLPTRTIYRAIYSYLDPWIRAAVLRQSIHEIQNIRQGSYIDISNEEGKYLNFMHPVLQGISINLLFR